jgi:hypothetical protein
MTSSAFALSGCDEVKHITLAPVPADLKVCFGQFVPMPGKGAMSRQQTAALIAELKRSELAKSQCGQRLIGFYETQAEVYSR